MKLFQSKKERIEGLDILNGPILKKLIAFAIPVSITSILQWAYNAADAIVVGQFAGKTALAAVTANYSLINLIIGVMVGLSLGTSVVVAQGVGEKNEQKVRDTVGTSFIIAVVGGLLVAVAGTLLAPLLLQIMGTPEDVVEEAIIYLRIYFLGQPFNMFYLFGAGMLRAYGDSKRPLIYALISGLVNIVLNLLLVCVFHMGVTGVGIATAASMVCSAILTFVTFVREKGLLHLNIREVKFKFYIFKKVLGVGVPAGMQSVAFSLSNTIVARAINSFGSAVVAGSGAEHSIANLEANILSGFIQASTTFVGQCYGAKRMDRLQKSVRVILVSTVVVTTVVSGVFTLFGRQFLSLFNREPDVIEAGYTKMLYLVFPYVICMANDSIAGTLKAMGKSFVTMIITFGLVCGSRVIWVWTVFEMYPKIETIFFIYPVSWLLAGIGNVLVYFITKRKLKRQWAAEESSCIMEENTIGQ